VSEHGRSSEERQRERALSLLRQHGWNATSFQILEPGLAYWFEADACVAYMDTGRCWVVAGAPIAPLTRLKAVATAFCLSARRSGRRVAFFATEQRFVDAVGFDSTIIGAQAIWDPAAWQETLLSHRSLREQLKRAHNKGVQVRPVHADELDARTSTLRREIEALIAHWIGQKPMPPMGFLVNVHPFSFPRERRYFIAECDTRVVGFAAMIPVYARQGWFVEDLIRAPDAPNGTAELLIDAAIHEANSLGSRYFTLGLSPLAGAIEFWICTARRYGSALYDFAGLQAFKAKLQPRHWVPIYLSVPHASSRAVGIYDSLTAFAHGRLLRFGIEAFLRGPETVVQVIAIMLVPWTFLLGLLDAERWFLEAWLKWFWVGFDILLCSLLLSGTLPGRPGQEPHRSQRIRRQLRWINLVFGMTLFDALASLIQAFYLDLSLVTNPVQLAILTLGVGAPLVASVILYNVRRRIVQLAPR
jgi:phosphatidylglycerol lysyltransferase